MVRPPQQFYSLAEWWQQITNPWKKERDTHCSERYSICVTNEPGWTVEIPMRFWPWVSTEVLIAFVVLSSGKLGELKIDAEVFISPPEKLKLGNYELTSPVEHMSALLHQLKNDGTALTLLEPPKDFTMHGKKSARALFETRNEDGDPLLVDAYTFLSNQQVYAVIYRAKKDKFEEYRESAMKIIESFRVDSD